MIKFFDCNYDGNNCAESRECKIGEEKVDEFARY